MFRMPRKISTKRQSATRISTHTYICKTTFAAISSGNGPEELSEKPVEITRVVFPHDPPRCRSNCSSKAKRNERVNKIKFNLYNQKKYKCKTLQRQKNTKGQEAQSLKFNKNQLTTEYRHSTISDKSLR